MGVQMLRAVIKLSGEALSANGEALNDSIIDNIARQLKEISDIQCSLVVGGGNFWRGRSAKPLISRTQSDQIGMLATVMNGLYLAERLRHNGLRAAVMTPFPVSVFTELFEKTKAISKMEEGIIVIHAGGTGHPYFSTDSIASLRGAELEADCVFFAKNIDGVYNADPIKVPSARKFRYVSYHQIIREHLEALDISAMAISLDSKTDSYVFGLNEPDSIIRSVNSAKSNVIEIGTKISVSCEEVYYENK
jgi:uridylate kinase